MAHLDRKKEIKMEIDNCYIFKTQSCKFYHIVFPAVNKRSDCVFNFGKQFKSVEGSVHLVLRIGRKIIDNISINQQYDLVGDGWDINIASKIFKNMFKNETSKINQ